MANAPPSSQQPVRQRLCLFWEYVSYLVKHKLYVFRVACRLGVPWLGLLHDWSKFRPDEWHPYTLGFPGTWTDNEWPPHVQAAFDRAWLRHIHRNAHHPQHWVLRFDEDGVVCLEMPERYVREMVADWVGAGLAQGTPDTLAWWNANKDTPGYKLHPHTRALVETLLVHLATPGEARQNG